MPYKGRTLSIPQPEGAPAGLHPLSLAPGYISRYHRILRSTGVDERFAGASALSRPLAATLAREGRMLYLARTYTDAHAELASGADIPIVVFDEGDLLAGRTTEHSGVYFTSPDLNSSNVQSVIPVSSVVTAQNGRGQTASGSESDQTEELALRFALPRRMVITKNAGTTFETGHESLRTFALIGQHALTTFFSLETRANLNSYEQRMAHGAAEILVRHGYEVPSVG
jgi:hypothetical protein